MDTPENQAAPADGPLAERVARDLSGDLRCVRCGYNQRGLSVRAMCPECGLPVLATVLGVVDPSAAQLQPIRRPRLVAGGLILWAGAALLSAMVVWWVQVSLATGLGTSRLAVWASTGLLVLSGLGAVVLIRPHAGIGGRRTSAGIAAVVLYVPLALVHARLQGWQVRLDSSPFLAGGGLSDGAHLLRLVAGAIMIGIILLVRPVARMLAARSLVVRTGRVDRQSMLSLAAALGVAALGDLVGLASSHTSDIARGLLVPVAHILIGMGSVLFTIGLAGILLDAIRVAPVILHPPVGVEQAFGDERMFE